MRAARIPLIGAGLLLLSLGLVGGFGLKTLLDLQRPDAPRFEVVDTAANCPDITHCTLVLHVRNRGGPGTGEARLTAEGASGRSLSCTAAIPRAEPGDLVEASCPITSSGFDASVFRKPKVTAILLG